MCDEVCHCGGNFFTALFSSTHFVYIFYERTIHIFLLGGLSCYFELQKSLIYSAYEIFVRCKHLKYFLKKINKIFSLRMMFIFSSEEKIFNLITSNSYIILFMWLVVLLFSTGGCILRII